MRFLRKKLWPEQFSRARVTDDWKNNCLFHLYRSFLLNGIREWAFVILSR